MPTVHEAAYDVLRSFGMKTPSGMLKDWRAGSARR
jgi:hypothetical protein